MAHENQEAAELMRIAADTLIATRKLVQRVRELLVASPSREAAARVVAELDTLRNNFLADAVVLAGELEYVYDCLHAGDGRPHTQVAVRDGVCSLCRGPQPGAGK